MLKSVRRRAGLSQAELARRAGTSQPVVSAYEHGRRDPSFTTLARLIEAGGEQLRISAAPPVQDLPRARDADEHNRRLLDVLSLADAIPRRQLSPVLDGPRMISS